VTCEYKIQQGATIPTRVHTVVISLQHSEDISLEQLRTELMEKVVKVVIPEKYLDDQTVYHIQPSGRFVIGGPQVCAICVSHSIIYLYGHRTGTKYYLLRESISSSACVSWIYRN